MRHSGEIAGSLHKELRDRITSRLETQEEQVAELTRNDDAVRERQVLMSARRLAAVQKRALSDASQSGRISDTVARRLARDIDIEVEDAPNTLAREPGDAADADPSSGDEQS